MQDKNLVRVYADQQFTSTAMVRHEGMVVAFAVGADRRIYYSVLAIDQADRAKGPLDAAYWNNDPGVLAFPSEIVDVAAEIPAAAAMPIVEKLSGKEVKPGVVLAGDRDPFLSTTARLTSAAPIQVLSDGRYILVFRQAVVANEAGSVYQTTGGGLSADPARTDYVQTVSGKAALTDGSLLCDRFVLVGSELKPVVEVRYQRSRSRVSPASGGDVLGTRDMEGRVFYEPTMKLSFVAKLTGGAFTVLLLPTSVAGFSRWQIFAVNASTGVLLGYNLEQGRDGLFNVNGTQLYTSPDPRFAPSVLERAPGIDPNTKKPLVPVGKPPEPRTGRAWTGLTFDATKAGAARLNRNAGRLVPAAPYTVEVWMRPTAPGGLVYGRIGSAAGKAVVAVGMSLDDQGRLVFVNGASTVTSSAALTMGAWVHVAAVFDGTTMRLFVNGADAGTLPSTENPQVAGYASLGARVIGGVSDGFTGDIDEVRIWRIARTDFSDRDQPLIGNEKGLESYFPLDEASGTYVRSLVGGFDGTVDTGPVWVNTDPPVEWGPGMRRRLYAFDGRSLAGGLSALLYYQQVPDVTGYAQAPKQEKRQARVLLACTTSGPAPDGGSTDRSYVATIDFAVSMEGRLAEVSRPIKLSPVGKPDPTGDLEKIKAGEAAVTKARGALQNDQVLLQDARATLARFTAIDRELYGGLPGFSLVTLNERFYLARPNEVAYEKALRAEAATLLPKIIAQEEARKRQGGNQAALAKALNELATLSGGLKGGAQVVLPLPSVSTDRAGLSVYGGLLLFAWTTGAPSLLDSSTGEVAMYFRGGTGQFFAAYYATLVSPAVKQIVLADKRVVRLVSRDPAVNLADFSVTVSADGPGRSKVVVTRGAVTETFPGVPGRADQFAAVLNGSTGGPEVGVVDSVKDTTIQLRQPLAAWLPPGSAIAIGGQYRTVESAGAGATQINVTTGDLVATAGTPVRTVLYDYSRASSTVAGVSLVRASQIVGADAGTASGPVPAATAEDLSPALVPRWCGDAPGRAFSFDGTAAQRLELSPGRDPAALTTPGDVCIEAWAYPTSVKDTARILNNYGGNTSVVNYSLGLEKATLASGQPGYTVFGVVNDQIVRGGEVFPLSEWAHLAMCFEQSWAMGLNGGSYLDAGGAGGLDLTADLTIETFVRLDAVDTVQGLVGKGAINAGDHTAVPYALYVEAGGKLAFTFEAGDGGPDQQRTYQSDVPVKVGAFTKVAVTRRSPTTLTGKVEIRFYIDGQPVGGGDYGGARPVGNDASVLLGQHRVGKATYGLRGALAEARIWRVARNADQIGAAITAKADGLAAWWTFPETDGGQTADSCGAYPATLRGAVRVRTPDPRGNSFTLYRNGTSTPATLVGDSQDPLMKTRFSSTRHLAVGARRLMSNAWGEGFTGDLDEIRLWRSARTQEQLLDNMFGRVRGDLRDLICYYPFDINDTVPDAPVRDAGLGGNDLVQSAPPPKIVLSGAPISSDAAQVQPVLTAVGTPFQATIAATPAVTEYADAQLTARRGLTGVMKRVYCYLDGTKWTLVTGYKVGELISTWVGQAQFDPQLIGYIEGAPPVPSENLIVGTADTYADASAITFVQADNVTNSLASKKEISVDMAAKLKFAKTFYDQTSVVAAPLGVGTAKPALEVRGKLEGNVELKYSNGWTNETTVSQGTTTTRSSSVSLSGGWEDEKNPVNPTAGQRWVPANTGFAVVQSDTADLFALRLAHTGALVAYRMLPSPDIPRDWNLIPFPVNPRYTKQGTLDGLLGFAEQGPAKELAPFADPDFPNAGDGGEYSYFRPREAYRIKKRIEREQQQLQGFYDSVNTETRIGAEDPIYDRYNKVLSGMTGGLPVKDGASTDSSKGRQANKDASRRNIVNTYVWTARGGFFSETTGTTDQVTVVTAGSYKVSGTVTVGGSLNIKAVAGLELGFEVSLGGGSTVTRTKNKQSTRTFSLDVSCKPGNKLQKSQDGKPVFDADGKPVLVPGRVDAYRFLSFYLDTTTDNFEDFYGKVIDPEWLERSKDPNALALKAARQTTVKPPCWRILHRVTFVSRVLSTAPPAQPSLERTMRLNNIASSYALIKQLEPHLGTTTSNLTALTTTARTVIAQRFPAFTPYTADVISILINYYQPADTPLAALSAPTVPSRAYLVAGNVEKVFDVAGAGLSNDVLVDVSDWSGADNQKFTLEPIGDGYYKLTAKHSGKALTVTGGNTTNGTTLDQWTWCDVDWQKFKIEPVAGDYYRLTAKHTGKAVTVRNGATAPGTLLEQQDWADLPQQKFQLRAIADTAW